MTMKDDVKKAINTIYTVILRMEEEPHFISDLEQLKDSAEVLSEEIEELEQKIISLEEDIGDFEGQVERLNEEQDTQYTRAEYAEQELVQLDLCTLTLYDHLKNKVLSNLSKNLTLEQLEAIQADQKALLGNKYIILN